MRKHLVPFLCGFVGCPAFIWLHECGHYVAGSCLGLSAKLHFGETVFTSPKGYITQHENVLATSGGPLLGVILATLGFFWLRRLRMNRNEAPATATDWLATSLLVFNAGRWFRAFAGTPLHPLPTDEAFLAAAIGVPPWLLTYSLGLLAVVALVATVRLYPPRGRLFPFLSLGLGGVLGAFLWMNLVGPFLLP
jgi:hypothetical protein